MADPAYRPITPRTLGRGAYVPENNPEFMRRQQEPGSYDLFKQSVIQKVYDEALRATGSEERAREAASSASRKMFRTELVGSALAPEAAMAGAGRAVNVAKGLFGRGQAAESASPLLLAPPRRNAMFPDEMMAADTPSVLRMSPDRSPSLPSSQSLPRLGYDSGSSSAIRMAPDRPPSLASSQSLPRLGYDAPSARGSTPPSGPGFTMGESSSSGVYRPDFTMPGGSQFGLPTTRGGTNVSGTGAPAPSAGGLDINAILRMLGGAGAGGGATAAALDAARGMRGEEQAGASVPANAGAPAPSAGGFDIFDIHRRNAILRMFGGSEAAGGSGAAPSNYLIPDRPGLPDDALGGFGPADAGASNYLMPSRPGLPDDALGGSPRSAAPSPDMVPASQALWELYNESMNDDGGGRADLFLRADREMMKEQGLARGGVANSKPKGSSGGKDSAVHKALEIIHHMMVNR